MSILSQKQPVPAFGLTQLIGRVLVSDVVSCWEQGGDAAESGHAEEAGALQVSPARLLQSDCRPEPDVTVATESLHRLAGRGASDFSTCAMP